MQEISIFYRKWMRAGSLSSLFFLIAGLSLQVAAGERTEMGYLFLITGILLLLITPLIGLIIFFIVNFRQKEFKMAFLILFLFILLIGGSWIVHPG
jgi:hypothetical protein